MSSNAATSTLALRVSPGSKRDELWREAEGWRARVAAPPAEGRANERLCTFLAREVLGLPARAVRVKAGQSGRQKLVEVDLDAASLAAALTAWEARPRG
jgi:uncharacterized protein YggU (UPF0235/DUF167 family)